MTDTHLSLPSTDLLQQNNLFRIGGLSAMSGVVLGIVFAMLGPMNLDPQDMDSVLQTFAADKGKLQFHGLGVTLGAFLTLGGLVALSRSLLIGPSAAWARLALAVAIVKTVLHVIGPMMGGSVMPAIAESYLRAPLDSAAGAMSVGKGFFIFYEALLAPTLLVLSVTVLLFAAAVFKSKIYPVWTGWAAMIAGLYAAAGGVAFIFTGPMGAADIMNVVMPGFMLSMVWIFIMGMYLFRLR
jgi:hypothetical protein